MAWHRVAVLCAECGQEHIVSDHRRLPGLRADQAGTVEELYPGQLPPSVADLVNSAVWCDTSGGYRTQPDPAKWRVWPRPTLE